MAKLSELFAKRIGQRLQGWGEKSDFAQRSGISRPTLDRWLAGANPPDLAQVEAVATAFGVSPIDLLFPGEIPRAPAPSDEQVIDGFLDQIAEITRSPSGRTQFREAMLGVLKNSRIADKGRPHPADKGKGSEG